MTVARLTRSRSRIVAVLVGGTGVSLTSGTLRAQDRLWSLTIGTPGGVAAAAVMSDGSGGVIVAGSTTGSLGGANAGGSDIWLARFDRHGRQVWLRQFGTSADDAANALAPDGAGGFFVAGGTSGSLGGANAGGIDIWVGRFDVNGNQLWLAQTGTTFDESARGLAADGAGGVFIAADSNLARYDASGSLLWFLPDSAPYALAAAPDEAGGFFGAGDGGLFAWVVKLDGAGNPVWWRWYNPNTVAAQPFAAAVLSDGAGGAYAAGWGTWESLCCFGWLAHFDSHGMRWQHGWDYQVLLGLASDGAGGVFAGGSFLARISADGTQLWSVPVGGINGVAADGRGGVFAAGTSGSSPNTDAFLARYGPCYANCDDSTDPPMLNILDFTCFLNAFAAGSPYANCDGSTTPPVLNVFDFVCFLNKFAAGCP